MFCKHCGAQLPDMAVFCNSCGKQVGRFVARHNGAAGQSRPAAGSQTRPQAVQPTPQGAWASAPAPAAAASSRAVSSPSAASLPHMKLIVGIAVAVVLVVAALVMSGVLGGSGHVLGGSGHGKLSAAEVAQSMTDSLNGVVDDGFSSESVVHYALEAINLMPGDAVAALMEESGIDDKEDLAEELSDSLGSLDSLSDLLSSYLDKMDISIGCSTGDELTSSELEDVNDALSALGIDENANKGYDLDMSVSMTALEDVGTLDAGETREQTSSSTGMYAIELDGKWYLWIRSIDL